MSEKWTLKVSCTTDLSPTATFSLAALPASCTWVLVAAGWGVPGVGMWVGTGRGYTGYYPPTLPDPIYPYLVIF